MTTTCRNSTLWFDVFATWLICFALISFKTATVNSPQRSWYYFLLLSLSVFQSVKSVWIHCCCCCIGKTLFHFIFYQNLNLNLNFEFERIQSCTEITTVIPFFIWTININKRWVLNLKTNKLKKMIRCWKKKRSIERPEQIGMEFSSACSHHEFPLFVLKGPVCCDWPSGGEFAVREARRDARHSTTGNCLSLLSSKNCPNYNYQKKKKNYSWQK